MREMPAIGECLSILYSDGQYGVDRWRDDVWVEKCCIIISIIGKTIVIINRRHLRLVVRLLRESVPLRLTAGIPIEAQVDILLNNIYIIFQLVLLFIIGLISIFDIFPASKLVAVFVFFCCLTLLGPRLDLLSICIREGRSQGAVNVNTLLILYDTSL